MPATRGRDQCVFSALLVAAAPAWGPPVLSLPVLMRAVFKGGLVGAFKETCSHFLYCSLISFWLPYFSFFRQMLVSVSSNRCSLPQEAGERGG